MNYKLVEKVYIKYIYIKEYIFALHRWFALRVMLTEPR